MRRALNGWTTKRNAKLVTQVDSDYETSETTIAIVLDINIQPVPATQVNRKPEGQRQWKWWSLIVKDGPLLSVDDVVIINSIAYRIQNISNWSESGFQKYESTEDYIEPST